MKNIQRIIFFVLLTLVSCRYFFHQGVPVTHDGNNHLIRFANYKIAIRELQFPPRLAPNLVNGYGYPVFNYNYPLANLVSLPFSILNFHYETTFKIIISASVFLSFVGAYLFLSSRNFSKQAKIFALAVFALNPYIFTSIIFRGNIGEVMAWSILPWIFYFLERAKLSQKFFDQNFFYLSLSFTLLFLAHNITAFFACIMFGFYLLFNYKLWKKFIASFIWAFANALWFWLPAIVEKNLITLDKVDLTLNYYKHFPEFLQLLRLPIYFGYSYWSSVDSMSFGLGAAQLLIILLALIYLFKKKTHLNLVFFLMLFVLFLGQLKISRPLYDLLPFANFIQFPWRLALLLSVALLPVTAAVVEDLKKPWRTLLIIILILQLWQFVQVKPIDYRHKNQIDYDADPGTTSVNQENMPKSFTFPFFEEKQPPVFLLSGNGQIKVDSFFGSRRSYSLDLKEKSTVVESTAYFQGWETKANGKRIDYTDNIEIKGRIAYELDAGQYEIKSRFTQKTWPRLVGNFVSSLSLLLMVIFFFFTQKRIK